MDYLEYKGYKGSVEYSKADNCLFGKVQGMRIATLALEAGTTINGYIKQALENQLKMAH